MTVSASTASSDTVLFLRDDLRSNITDPIVSTRPSDQKFVMTSYPKRTVVYPLITVRASNQRDQRLGQMSEVAKIMFNIEIRIWARNEKEKAQLTDSVYARIRTNQFPATTSNTSSNVGLFDPQLLSATDVDEDGEEAVKSKVLTYYFMFITN